MNASATEDRNLALPGHVIWVVALDGNPVPVTAEVLVLWLGTAERISGNVEMNHPVAPAVAPDETIEMTFVMQNAAAHGFNLWTINGAAFAMDRMTPKFELQAGRRYRLNFATAATICIRCICTAIALSWSGPVAKLPRESSRTLLC